MIISFSGRKSSGKTTLADALLDKGFEKVSFADRLKELVSKIYEWPLEDLSNGAKKEENLCPPVKWGIEESEVLGKLIGALSKLERSPQIFYSRRQALQYIGTEVLRKYDPDFHVKSIRERILPGHNYVLDDVRFPNELSELKRLGAICVFILRPYYFDDYSNHASEISVTKDMVENIIVNDGSLHKFLRKSNMFLDSVLSSKKPVISKQELQALLMKFNYDTLKVAEYLKCSRDKVIWWATKNLVYIPRNTYTHDPTVFSKSSPEAAYWAGLLSADGCIKKHLKHDYLLELSSDDLELVEGFKNFVKSDKALYSRIRENGKVGYTFTLSCPFLIDDLKFWCIGPRKSKYNKIPDIIKDNQELLAYWLIGLIDGDGSIHPQGRSLCITFLASKEIVEFVDSRFNSSGRIYSEKGIDNLYSIKYFGNNAIDFYQEVYRPRFGLDRKWKKVEKFIQKKNTENSYGRTQRQDLHRG